MDHAPLATPQPDARAPTPTPAPHRRICLTVEYDGGSYQGWQRQEGLPSVQATLEAALTAATGEAPATLKLACAGRTDAGVHATGQLCSFVTADAREARRFVPALNHYLPADVRVHLARRVADDFDVRRASDAKWYRYDLYLGAQASALYARRAWHVRKRLDVAQLRAAAAVLIGEHDFESYRSAHCEAAHARRCLYAIDVGEETLTPIGTLLHVDLYGNAFCRHMCRILVGTLVEVGCGVRPLTSVAATLAARDRRAAGITAPAHGLTLKRIYLPDDADVAARPWQAALSYLRTPPAPR